MIQNIDKNLNQNLDNFQPITNYPLYSNIAQNQEFQLGNVNQDAVFPDEGLQEMQVQESQLKDMVNRQPLGFDRKLRDLATTKKSVSKGGQKYESLDSKANMISPIKNLGYYSNKGEVQFKVEEGKAIQMITWNQYASQFNFTQEAMELIQQQSGPVSFVSMQGQPFSGKSSLMNYLINVNGSNGKQQDFFQVNHQLQTQQSQILMWNNPTYNQQTNTIIFFIDVQYSNEQQKTQQDIQLFYISMIISSIAFINVKGGVSLDILQPLEPFLNLQDFVLLENLDDKDQFSRILAKMIFLFRDHKHVIMDQGKPIAGHSYLDNFIFDDAKFDKSTPQQLKIRKRFAKYVRCKDGFSMVYPLDKKQDIKGLMTMEFQELQEQFQEEVRQLRKNIVYSTKKKEFQGVYLNATMMISLISSILEDINSNQKINIHKAYKILLENEFICVYNKCVDLYNGELAIAFADDQYKTLSELMQILRHSKELAMEFFFQLKAHDVKQAETFYDEYYKKLTQVISEKEQKVLNHNQESQLSTITDYANKIQAETKKLTANQSLKSDDLQTITNNYEKLLQTIMKSCISEQYNEEPAAKLILKAQTDLIDLFYGEINEMYSKNELSQQKIEKLQEEHNQQKLLMQNQQVDKLKQLEDYKINIEQKIQQTEEKNQKLQTEIDKCKKENTKKKTELTDLKKDLDQARIQREQALQKKGQCIIF